MLQSASRFILRLNHLHPNGNSADLTEQFAGVQTHFVRAKPALVTKSFADSGKFPKMLGILPRSMSIL